MNFAILPKVDLVMNKAQQQIETRHQLCSHAVLAVAAREAVASLRAGCVQEIKDREQQLKRIEEENDQLRINLSSLQSIYLLEEKKEELGMVNPEKVDFIELKGVEKLVLAK